MWVGEGFGFGWRGIFPLAVEASGKITAGGRRATFCEGSGRIMVGTAVPHFVRACGRGFEDALKTR